MKNLYSTRLVIRFFIVAVSVTMIIIGALIKQLAIPDLCIILSAGTFLLLLYPLSYEREKCSLWLIVFSSLIFMFSEIYVRINVCLWYLLMYVTLYFIYYIISCAFKYLEFGDMIDGNYFWNRIEDNSRSLFSIIAAFLYLLLCVFFDLELNRAWFFALCFLQLALFLLLYYRAYTGRSFLVKIKTEEKIQALSYTASQVLLDPEEEKTLKIIYDRVNEHMQEKRPFLSDRYTLDMLAKDVYSNRGYVSKSINFFSRMNFCKFINLYRINHALELIKKNPKIKL